MNWNNWATIKCARASAFGSRMIALIEGRYDVARGHPEKPLSWEELGDKFRDCADLVLPRQNAEEAIQLVARIEQLKSLGPLFKALAVGRAKSTRKTNSGKSGRKKWNPTRKA